MKAKIHSELQFQLAEKTNIKIVSSILDLVLIVRQLNNKLLIVFLDQNQLFFSIITQELEDMMFQKNLKLRAYPLKVQIELILFQKI